MLHLSIGSVDSPRRTEGGRLAGCGLEECSQWFLRVKHYDTLTPGSNEPYCQALITYLKCLNDTTLGCRGNLQFYTNLFAMRKQFREFGCASYKQDEARNSVVACLFSYMLTVQQQLNLVLAKNQELVKQVANLREENGALKTALAEAGRMSSTV
ncbi:unnamed protein product [Heligmosomoides polygyrus]|uniref:RGM_N domain-containing protein n=1 Tax=Heligmosomoides polygyrus TaxID=6339 RepID=A0A3P8AUE7_HELPZ|nr:unnamed protein product [Heligmosomoides polygyrus]